METLFVYFFLQKCKTQCDDDEQRTKPSDICKNIKSSIGGHSSETHNALMDEFREKHKKMFRNGFRETENDSVSGKNLTK